MVLEHVLKAGFKRTKPVTANGSTAVIQRLMRVFIDECHLRGYAYTDIEESIRQSGEINMYKGKIANMANGQMKPYQYFYMFDVLFGAIGCDFADFVKVVYSDGSPYVDPIPTDKKAT